MSTYRHFKMKGVLTTMTWRISSENQVQQRLDNRGSWKRSMCGVDEFLNEDGSLAEDVVEVPEPA